MYESADTIYCYPNSEVLRNLADLRTAKELEEFELAMTAQRAEEPLPAGRFSASHFRAIHHHLFQDVYAWAGKLRRIRIAKGDTMFCYPENIQPELRQLFGKLRKDNYLRCLAGKEFIAKAATFLATLNAIHAFRDGNGRTQLAFLAMLAAEAGYPLYTDELEPDAFLQAMIASFNGDEIPLRQQLVRMTI
jgi:cell filamentation protein